MIECFPHSEPEVQVLGGPDLFINSGSFINLTCSGNNLPGIPEDVHWYHEKQVRTAIVNNDMLHINFFHTLLEQKSHKFHISFAKPPISIIVQLQKQL